MLRLSNLAMRRALLSINGLARPAPNDPLPAPDAGLGTAWALGMVRRLGFVQVDTISVVERAQHLILFTRNPRYRQDDLRRLLEDERALFESWTHDAAILPVEVFPYWKHYFARAGRFEAHPGYRRYFAPVTAAQKSRALRRIVEDGSLRPRDLGTSRVDWHDPYFAKPTLAKLALELLWRTGKLAVTRRAGQEKVYDLTERIIPAEHFEREVPRREYVDWACREALKRLGVGTPAQIARFFDAVSTDEARSWCQRRFGTELIEVRPEHADGGAGTAGFALESMLEALRGAPPAPRALRLLSPFDPLIHDRQRTRRIFGFDYTAEIWVPPAKRKYGYYVLPILEGERFTGRVDGKVDRRRNRLDVLGTWWESGVKVTPARRQRLERELQKLARFVGVGEVVFARR